MSERGVSFSAKDHRRVSHVTLAYERGELGPQAGSSSSSTPRRREPIRAMLLTDLGPADAEREWQGDVCRVEAIVTECDPESVRWMIRSRFRAEDNVDPDNTFVLSHNAVETPDLSWTTTPEEMYAHLDALPGLTGMIVSVEGIGDAYGPVDESAEIDFPLWWVTMDKDWPESRSPGPANTPLIVARGAALCQQTDWRLTDHIETIHSPFGVREEMRAVRGSFVLATHFGGRGYLPSEYECFQLDTE